MKNYTGARVVHRPLLQPRAGVPGEAIYLKLWHDFIETRPEDVPHIFHDLPFKLDQRGAQVAASFMVFLGCNCGAAMIQNAEEFARDERFLGRERAFLASWAIENERKHHVSGGARTIEAMLGASSMKAGGRYAVISGPSITLRDLDVVECMMIWMSTAQGEALREVAKAQIEVSLKAERFAHQGYWGLKTQEADA